MVLCTIYCQQADTLLRATHVGFAKLQLEHLQLEHLSALQTTSCQTHVLFDTIKQHQPNTKKQIKHFTTQQNAATAEIAPGGK
jgi:hypothetical protein